MIDAVRVAMSNVIGGKATDLDKLMVEAYIRARAILVAAEVMERRFFERKEQGKT